MKKFAVLISGGYNSGSNYERYINDLAEMYKTLVQKYGYLKSDITVLYADGSDHDLDGDGISEISNSATKANVISTFQDIKNRITANDMLFIFTTNHGGQTRAGTPDVRLWLWNQEYIEDNNFATLLDDLSYKIAIITMEQCYSGGFIDNLQGQNRVIATACRWDEVSWACDSEGNYDEFCYYWTAAVRGNKPDGTPVDAAGPDGKVSLKDAFNFAETHDSVDETPQYYENPEGLGDKWTLGGLITVEPICRPFYKDFGCRLGYKDFCQPYRDIKCWLGRDICSVYRDFSCKATRDIPQCWPTRDFICRPSRDFVVCRLRDTFCRKDIREPICRADIRLPLDRYTEMRDAYLRDIRSLYNSGADEEDIAATLEEIAMQMETDLNEIHETLSQLRGIRNRHFRRMTR